MIQVFDLDVRALAAADGDRRSQFGVLAGLGRWARQARVRGLDGIAAVARFSTLRSPCALEVLRDAATAGGGLIKLGRRAAVLLGGAVCTQEAIQLVVYGPPDRLIDFAGAFPRSLFRACMPALGDALCEARACGLIVAVRTAGSSRDERLDLGQGDTEGLHALLTGPDTDMAASREAAAALGVPLIGGSGAVIREDVGERFTVLGVEELSFEGIRSAILAGHAGALRARGAIRRPAVSSSSGALRIALRSAG